MSVLALALLLVLTAATSAAGVSYLMYRRLLPLLPSAEDDLPFPEFPPVLPPERTPLPMANWCRIQDTTINLDRVSWVQVKPAELPDRPMDTLVIRFARVGPSPAEVDELLFPLADAYGAHAQLERFVFGAAGAETVRLIDPLAPPTRE